MPIAVIYARFSSNKQTEDSIEAQIRACKDYAAVKGIHVIDTYVDEAISGKGSKTAKRAQYQKLLRDTKKKLFDTILIHKYDRIARNLGEHVNLEKKLHDLGIQLIAVSQDFGNTKESKIMRSLVWAMSEYYIDNLAEETKKGLKESALKGLHNGGYAPFGYDVVDRKYVINPLEAAYVVKMFECCVKRIGFTDLIAEMEAAGITGKRGKPIKYPQIKEILRNEKYTGVYLYSPNQAKKRADRRQKPEAIRIENAFPAIIDKELFREVQMIMNERKQTGKKSDYLCSGLVYCQCGAKMHGITSHRKGHEYSYYYCSDKCGIGTIRMEDVDNAAIQYLRNLLSEENQLIITDRINQYNAQSGTRERDFYAALKKKVQEKQRQYDTLVQNLASGVLPATVLEDIGEKMNELKAQIDTLKNTKPPVDYTTDQVRAWLESIKSKPDKEAIRLLIERIDVIKTKEKTVFNIQSTLKTVLGESGCGSTQHCLPRILFYFKYTI